MRVFLVRYDRRRQRLIEIREFSAARRPEAEEARFRAELEALRRHQDMEIVILEADSLDVLRQTHRSYFPETLPELPASA
jgi:hypothetical protein